MRQLIIIAVLVMAYVFIKRWIRETISSAGQNAQRGGTSRKRPGRTVSPDAGEEMVQDPNCNAFVPVSRAVTYRHDGETVHFCSDKCADEYARKLKSGDI